MKVFHVSDTHGVLTPLITIPDDAEVILWTGDILPNFEKGVGPVRHKAERDFQLAWLTPCVDSIRRAIGDRPLITVGGNHDFIPLAPVLKGVRVFEITARTPAYEVEGLIWAGFPEIPWIGMNWANETWDLRPAIKRALQYEPDILVTHCPGSVLGGVYGGSGHLGRAIREQPSIKYHFFGHAHDEGGKVEARDGVTYVNGACFAKLHLLK